MSDDNTPKREKRFTWDVDNVVFIHDPSRPPLLTPEQRAELRERLASELPDVRDAPKPLIPPPWFLIAEEMDERGWDRHRLADRLGVDELILEPILSGELGIDSAMSKSLGKAFDRPDRFFLKLQRAFDLSRSQRPVSQKSEDENPR